MEEVPNLNKGNQGSRRQEFDQAVKIFLDTFIEMPYEEMDDQQKKLADEVKSYLESRRPTIH